MFTVGLKSKWYLVFYFQIRDFVPLGNCSERDSNIPTNATTFCSYYENQQELSSVFLYPTGQSVSSCSLFG